MELTWSNVDLDHGRITLADSRIVLHGRTSDKRGGKTANADKTIAIDACTVAALRRWRAEQEEIRRLRGPDYEGGDLVFTTEFGPFTTCATPTPPRPWRAGSR